MAALAIINPKKRRKARKAKRRANPVARKRSKATVRVRKAKRGRGRVITVRTKNPARRRSRRRNPSMLSGAALKSRVLPALTGAVGAMIVDKGFDMLGDKLPAMLQTGWGRHAAKAGLAVLAGVVLEKTKVLDAKSRDSLVLGSLTVIGYQAIQAEVMPMIGTGFSTAPAPGVKGFQYGNLMGYRDGTLAEMTNTAPTLRTERRWA